MSVRTPPLAISDTEPCLSMTLAAPSYLPQEDIEFLRKAMKRRAVDCHRADVILAARKIRARDRGSGR
jgi:hypothetical protein